MKAVILAAGRATRTYPLTRTRPKHLLRVANKTIIEHNLDQLKGLVTEFIIVLGYKGEMIQEHLGNSYHQIPIKYVWQSPSIKGTAAAVLAAKDHLENQKESFLVLCADDLFSKRDLVAMTKHKAAVLVQEVEDLTRFGEVVVQGKEVLEIREKQRSGKGYANTATMVLPPSIFELSLSLSPRGELELTDYIKLLTIIGETVRFEVIKEYWLPITYPWSVLDANEYLLGRIKRKIHKAATIEKGVTLKGAVQVGKGTLIKAGAYIEGPVLIGENCLIGPNTFIRGKTSIANNCKIGHAVEIKNSVIDENSTAAHLNYIGDSVIGKNVNLSGGTILANLRHDGKVISSPIKGTMVSSGRRKLGAMLADGVKTGINTCIYPGRKLGPFVQTLPGQIVRKDILQQKAPQKKTRPKKKGLLAKLLGN